MATERLPQLTDEEFGKVWEVPKGIWGWLTTVQNEPLGTRFIGVAILFFVLGGINALLLRTQLVVPNNSFIDAEWYNRLMTMHGSTMMFLFVVPLTQGIATLVLPQMLGARELPFPRLTAFAFWTFLFGGLLFYSSFFFNAVPEAGWFAYVPLSAKEFAQGKGMDFWLLGLNVAEVGAISGAMELIIAFFKVRAPGMTLSRVPILAWAFVAQGFMMIFGFTPLIVGSMMLEIDRMLGTVFFDPNAGGDVLLWQHIFWLFGHPEVYIQFVPAAGIMSTIVPVFSQRKLAAYPLIVVSIVATSFLSFGLWVHHMFATGLPELSLPFFTAASMVIAIPTGIQVLAWTWTMFKGRPRFDTPLLFAAGTIAIFVLGGLTGVMLAVVPFDLQGHDTYFVVAHFHYVLLGGVVLPIMAAVYYWAPKFTHTMLSERLGKWNFWLMFIGINLTFFPMHFVGLLGMPRRTAVYDAGLGWELPNLLSTIGAFVIAAGVMVFLYNLIASHVNKVKPEPNLWDADTLEWGTEYPHPDYGFRRLPIVRSRHPLWDQESITQGPQQMETLLDAFAKWPTRWRSQLMTGALDARPQEVVRLPASSIWPFALSFGLMFATFFLIFEMFILAGICAALMVAAIVGWHVQDDLFVGDETEYDELFEDITGVPVRLVTGRSIGKWVTFLAATALGVALLTMLFAYFYLRLGASSWPPEGAPMPSLALPPVALAVLGTSAIPLLIARRSLRQGRRQRLLIAMIVLLVLGLAGLGLFAFHYLGLPFNHSFHAYGSIFWGLSVVQAGIILGGLVIAGFGLYWTVRERGRGMLRWRSVENTVVFWTFSLASSAVVFFTLYIVPYLL